MGWGGRSWGKKQERQEKWVVFSLGAEREFSAAREADTSQGEQESSPTFQLVQITVTSSSLSLECGSVGVDIWAERKQYTRILD